MARKHAKQRSQKQPVEKVILKPAVVSRERVAREVSKGTEGAIPIAQEDGSTKWFLVGFKVVEPEVAKYIACGPTTKGHKKNVPSNMAPKGKSGK